MSAIYPTHGDFPLSGASPITTPPAASRAGAAPASSSAWNASFATPGSAAPLPKGLRAGRGPGLLIVIGVHLLIAWALASGLARDVINIVKKPIEMVIVPEVIPPPPPPPPPKLEKIKDIPKPPPPPSYVPPPDITPLAPPPAPVIQAVQPAPPPEPVVIAPPPPPIPEVKVEPPKKEISLACPGYQNVISEALESAFDRVGIVGTVRTLIKVRGSQVVDVTPQSGPKEYYKYLQTAIKRIRCSAGGDDEVQVMLDVSFKR